MGFVVDGASDTDNTETLISAGAALQQFLLALKAQGFGAIVLSGSALKDPDLQAAFCHKPAEKLVAWITIGTPSEGVRFEEETRNGPFEVWSGS